VPGRYARGVDGDEQATGRSPLLLRLAPAAPYLAVGLVAAVAQVVAIATAPRALYFPDSYCYVSWSYCPNHSPNVSLLWQVMTLGVMTEVAVLTLQALLVVAGSLLLTGALRKLAPTWVAVAAGCLFAAYPMNLLLERVLMPETLQTFFLVLFLFAASRSFTTPTLRRQLAFGALGMVALGLLASVHASVLVAALLAAGAFAAALALRLRRRGHLSSVPRLVGALAVAGLLVVLPIVPVSVRMHSTFGTWSPNPTSGTYLAATWAPLLSCPTATSPTDPLAREMLGDLCRIRTFTPMPGLDQQVLFTEPWNPAWLAFSGSTPIGTPITKATFRQTQAAMSQAAIDGILSHPLRFGHEVARSLWWQAVGPLAPPFPPFHEWLGPPVDQVGYPTISSFLAGAKHGGPPDEDHVLVAVANHTDRLAQALLWTAALGGLVRVGLALRRRRRGRPFRLEASARVALGLLATALTAAALLTVAIGGHPAGRYTVASVPPLLVLCALVVPGGRAAQERQPADG
jgi:hypothetical protein